MADTMPIFVVVREDQNEHGYVDTSIVDAYVHEGRAADRVRELEQTELDAGERVCGRESEWREGNGEDGAEWRVSFGYEQTTLKGAKDR